MDDVGQRRFETELNRLYGGVMTQFRDEFRNLLDETDIRFLVVSLPVLMPQLSCISLICRAKVLSI